MSRRYLLTGGLSAALLLLAVAAVSLRAKWQGQWDAPYNEVLEYQLRKLDRLEGIDTVFLGDSSLGNAIDTRVFDRLTGSRSASLALTGLYGYAGSYNMLRRALARWPLRRVIVVHTVGTLSSGPSWRGYLFTTPVPGELFRLLGDASLRPGQRLSLAGTFLREVFDWRALGYPLRSLAAGLGLSLEHTRHTFVQDYVRQGTPLPRRMAAGSWSPGKPYRLDPDKAWFLHRIADLCRRHRLDCYYAHGPIAAGLAMEIRRRSPGYLRETEALLRSAGFLVLTPEPPAIPFEQLGDTVHHVAPPWKKAFTRRYARAFLQQGRPTTTRVGALP